MFVACLTLAVGAAGEERPGRVSVDTVVVVKNRNSADSVAIADYYASQRELPAENVCAVRMTDVEECSYKEFDKQLKGPLKHFLTKLNHPIDYIVLTKGIPIRTHEGTEGGMSVDSLVVTMNKPGYTPGPSGIDESQGWVNPYFDVAQQQIPVFRAPRTQGDRIG